MALKNLFDMVKADRYTQDGREALIKAQEAETEDVKYNIGDISQKTGLQKTANGWVKPKNGKQPGAKKQNAAAGSKKIDYQVTEKGGKFYATGHQFSDGSQLHAGPFGSEKELHEFMNGSPYKSTAESKPGAASKHDTDPQTYIVKKNDELRKMYLNEKDPAKKEAMKKALKKQASMMEPEPFSSAESKPDESARIAASKEARAKKSQELGQKAAGDFAKYKDLPPAQRKDALGAASHEGISIGMTQRSMEGMGWDLIQADDKVNVYGKPDGSKAIMKHDGKKITEVSYEGPGEEPGPDRDDSPERAAYERELSRQQAQRAADDPRGFGYEEPPMEPAAENKTVEKFDIEKWKTGPKVEKNSKLDWSHGVVGKSIPVQGKSAEEKRNLINKYNSVGRLSRIGTKKNSYYNNKYGTFEVAGIDNDNVYIQEERSNGMGSRYMALVTIPLNEVEEINPFHDYGKRNPDTGEESPTRPPLPEDAAPRVLTGDTRIRVRKA